MGQSVTSQSSRTYVVCPRRKDFIQWCQDHNVQPHDKVNIHIYNPLALLGHHIKPHDRIDYFNISYFQPEVYKEIIKQLKMRSNGHEF